MSYEVKILVQIPKFTKDLYFLHIVYSNSCIKLIGF